MKQGRGGNPYIYVAPPFTQLRLFTFLVSRSKRFTVTAKHTHMTTIYETERKFAPSTLIQNCETTVKMFEHNCVKDPKNGRRFQTGVKYKNLYIIHITSLHLCTKYVAFMFHNNRLRSVFVIILYYIYLI